jgi:hypothetical protein
MAKKIYITEEQFNKLTGKKMKKNDIIDAVKANRRKRREEDRDYYGDGFKQTTKISKSEKAYSRKGKNKFKNDFYDD